MAKEELETEATEYAQKLGVKDFIAKPKEIVAYFGYLAGAEPREKRIEELEKKNAEFREELEAKQVVLNDFKSRVEVVTERFNKKSSQLTKSKEIIKKLKALYFSPVVTNDDVRRQDEILSEAEQFLKE